MAGSGIRILLIVAGLSESHWRNITGLVGRMRLIDVRTYMPRDPSALRGPTLDSVARQTGFPAAVLTVVDTATVHNVVIVGCKAGKHRSTVVGATARLKLKVLGIQLDNNHLLLIMINHSASHVICSLLYCLSVASDNLHRLSDATDLSTLQAYKHYDYLVLVANGWIQASM